MILSLLIEAAPCTGKYGRVTKLIVKEEDVGYINKHMGMQLHALVRDRKGKG